MVVDGLLDRTVINGDDGFIIFVPPGARTLTVEFQTSPGAAVQLLVQPDRDVGSEGFANRADFLADPDGNSVATVFISSESGQPALKPAIYFSASVFATWASATRESSPQLLTGP